MKTKVITSMVIILFLASTILSLPIASAQAQKGWYIYTSDGTEHEVHWTGIFIRSMWGRELWKLTGTYDGSVEEATMTILWDPIKEEGKVTCFTHYGWWLYFTKWRGTITYDRCTGTGTFQIHGPGFGSFDPTEIGIKWNAYVNGYYNGVWEPADSNAPLLDMKSIADWAAIVKYYGEPVLPP